MWPFSSVSRSSAVLIDIGSSSVAGAYAHYADGQPSSIHYSVRVSIERRTVEGQEESIDASMLRALEEVCKELIEKGAPQLRRATGSGHASHVLVSVAAPWQETKVRTETIAPGKPFVFTRSLLSEAVASNEKVPEGRVSSGEAVIATILNGYEIMNPMGKRAQRAEIVILSSTLDANITDEIRKRVRHAYHAHDVQFAAFAPVAYAVMRDLYPHERDFLVLDVSGEGTDLAFVKNGLLVDVGTTPHGTCTLLNATRAAERMTVEEEQGMAVPAGPLAPPNYVNPDRNARFSTRAENAKQEWLTDLAGILKTFAENHPLPRTLFLLADPNTRDYLKRALDSQVLHALWLSDEPLTVIPVLQEQFASKVKTMAPAEADVFLSILTLYQQKVRTI